MIKRKINKEEYDSITSEDIKKLYTEGGDGNYGLSIEEDTALVNALTRVKDELGQKTTSSNELAEKLKLAQQHIDDLKSAEGKGKNALEAIENAWKKKYADLEAAAEKERIEQTAKIREAAVTAEATRIATAICVAPELMTHVVAGRLSADFHEGQAIIRVLDKEGKPSALSLTELAEEFKVDPRYEKVIIASKASGGASAPPLAAGATGIPSGSAASPKTKKFSDMSPRELALATVAHAAKTRK